ncbi:MAG: dTMP kinase [candidate division NC10 bacterium]|nr:dTMP kinase [candidate division NC10 bacterium]
MTGFFISFEGVEGSGKSTQLAQLAQHLRSRGFEVLELREPGGTPIGERVRHLLLDEGSQALAPAAELCLYLASRAQLVVEILEPALRAGQLVLCDRFSDSTFAYQGYGRGLDLESIQRLNQLASRGLVPDMTFLLDLEPEVGLGRLGGKDRLEKEDLSFHRRVREGYLALAKREPGRVKVIVADQGRETIAAEVRGHVEALLKERQPLISHGL